MPDTAYRTVDVRLALPGWTVHFLNEEGSHWTKPLVGWVLRDEHRLDGGGDFLAYTGIAPYRHICAGVVDDGHVTAVDDDPTFWYVAAPGDPEPTAAEIADAVKGRQAAAERRRQLAAGRAPTTWPELEASFNPGRL